MRLQLALNVPDIDAAVDYYSRMFATKPHKRKPGYANFAIANPALKLVLFEDPDAAEHLNHIGVEALTEETMDAAADRLADAALVSRVDEDTTCCHARQDKVWTEAHNGLSWEWYRIKDDNPDAKRDTLGKTCCVKT